MEHLPSYVPLKVSSQNVHVNSRESWDSINLNDIKNVNSITAFPKDLYKGTPIPVGAYMGSMRDLSTQYTFGSSEDKKLFPCYVERDEHPPHFSRFSYPVNPSLYMSGNIPGYVRANYNSDPPNMSPKAEWCNQTCRKM